MKNLESIYYRALEGLDTNDYKALDCFDLLYQKLQQSIKLLSEMKTNYYSGLPNQKLIDKIEKFEKENER